MDLNYILKNSAGNLYWKDLNGRYQGANQSFIDVMKAQIKDDFIGKTDREISTGLLNDAKISILEETDKRIMRNGIGESLIEEGLDAQGKMAFYLTKKIPLLDKKGKIIGILGTSLDITKEKQAEIAKNAFLRNMEHDLRTPFIGIGGSALMLQNLFVPIYPELGEWVDPMVKSCSEWESIHRHIFDAVHAGKQPNKSEEFSIQEELQKIADMMAATLHLKKLSMSIPSVDARQKYLIKTDRLKFQLILLALIGNAIKFTKEGCICIKVRCKNDFYNIDVIDTGIGIPADKFEYIFEEFTKLTPSNQDGNEFKGLGTGLYISQLEALALGAKITVKSTPGKGSTFTLSIPIHYRS